MAVLRSEVGVSLRTVAEAGGWSGASSVQKYFYLDYASPLRPNVAERLARSLGERVFEIAKEDNQHVHTTIADVIALLRDKSLPADTRCAAAAEQLGQIERRSR